MERIHVPVISGTVAAVAAACLVLSSCTPGASSSAAGNNAPASAVTTNPSQLGKQTISVLDYFTGGVDNTWMKDVIAGFEQKYPKITVQRQSLSWTPLMQALPLKLRSPSPPDVVPPNNGWQSLGTLVQGKLVANLTSYAAAYGWNREVPSSIMREQEFSSNGKKMGTGAVFGMPVALSSTIETYYNRSLLNRLGLGVPTTFSQFTADLAKAKKAGITPIAFGNLGQLGITLPLYSVMDALGNQAYINNLIYSLGNTSLDSSQSGFPQAVAAMKNWGAAGYFTPQFAGVSEVDAAQQFVNGHALFHFDYSGSLPFTGNQSKNFGSFIMPRNDGSPPVATMSSATEFCISSKSKHIAAAAAFLNYAASPAAARIAVKLGTDPMLSPSVTLPSSNPEYANEVTNAREVAAHNSSVPYLDWATPTLLNTLSVQMQELLAGKTSMSQAIAAVKADDVKYRSTLGK